MKDEKILLEVVSNNNLAYESEEEIGAFDFMYILRKLRKNIKIIIPLMILVSLLAFALLYFLDHGEIGHQYTSISTYKISENYDDGFIEDADKAQAEKLAILDSFIALLRLDKVTDATIEEIKPLQEDSPVDFENIVLTDYFDTQKVGASDVTNIIVTFPDPIIASKIADSLVTNLKQEVKNVYNEDLVQIISLSKTEEYAENIDRSFIPYIAAAIGANALLFLAFITIFLIQKELDKKKLLTVNDINKKLNLPILGSNKSKDKGNEIEVAKEFSSKFNNNSRTSDIESLLFISSGKTGIVGHVQSLLDKKIKITEVNKNNKIYDILEESKINKNVILILDKDFNDYKIIKELIDNLEYVGANIIGTILN